jgi:hypothetical protein
VLVPELVIDGVAVIEEVKVAVSDAVMLPVAVLVRLLLGVCVSLADGDDVCSAMLKKRRRGEITIMMRRGTGEVWATGRGHVHGR